MAGCRFSKCCVFPVESPDGLCRYHAEIVRIYLEFGRQPADVEEAEQSIALSMAMPPSPRRTKLVVRLYRERLPVVEIARRCGLGYHAVRSELLAAHVWDPWPQRRAARAQV